MSKNFRTCDLDQPFLLPPSLQDWLPENHLARFVAELTPGLDLSKIYGHYGRRDGRGKAAYHPVMMVRVLLYGYCVGVMSSRRIERASHDDIAFRYLCADQHPDHDTIADFHPGEDLIAFDHTLAVSAADVMSHAVDDGLGNVVISFDVNNTVTLRSVTTALLQQHLNDFHIL